MKLSPAQMRVLEFAAKGHLLIRTSGDSAGALWNGRAPGAPACRYDTADKLIKLNLLELDPDTEQPFWGKYFRISEAGRQALPFNPSPEHREADGS